MSGVSANTAKLGSTSSRTRVRRLVWLVCGEETVV